MLLSMPRLQQPVREVDPIKRALVAVAVLLTMALLGFVMTTPAERAARRAAQEAGNIPATPAHVTPMGASGACLTVGTDGRPICGTQ